MTGRTPQFTIAIPVHNGAAYIAEALDSVLAQTYPHFDVVVLENSSTDATLDIVQRYNDPRITIQPSASFLSIEDNWSRIPKIKSNEFLVLMCADDILFPPFLEEVVQLIQSEPAATLYHTHAVFIDDDGHIVDTAKPSAYTESAQQYITSLHAFREDAFGTGYVMRFADFQRVQGYPKFRRLLFADFYCYYSLTVLGYKACVPSQLVGFRRHSQGVTSQSTLNDFLLAASQYQEALLADPAFDGHDLLDRFLKHFLVVQYRHYLFDLIKQKHPREMGNFQASKTHFLSDQYPAKAYRYDFPLRWYAALAKFPVWIIRVLILYICMTITILLRKITRVK